MASSSNKVRDQLRQLKKAIRAEVHRKTGHTPPLLANDANFENAITFAELAPQNAWYILPNAAVAGNKITQLYSKNTLNKITGHTNPGQRVSPFTRIPIAQKNIRKYMNFNQREMPSVINLTYNAGPSSSARPRRGPLDLATLKALMTSMPAPRKVKIFVKNAAQTKKYFYITKLSHGYKFSTDDDNTGHLGGVVPEPNFIPVAAPFLAQYRPGFTEYCGYRTVW